MKINERNIDKVNELEKESLNLFKDRPVQVFRSNTEITTKYFGNREKDPCFFELLVFEFSFSGESEIFLKLPYFDFYIELTSNGSSARGCLTKSSLGNPIGDSINGFYYEGKLQPEKFQLYLTDSQAMIDFGVSDFIFLSKVADNTRYNEKMGYDIISEVLTKEYAKIPDFRKIAYALKNDGGDIVIVDQSAHKFTYNGMRCWYKENGKEFARVEIKDFGRYRDGGTTLFKFEYNGVEHDFFYPSKLGQYNLKPTLDENKLNEISEFEKYSICNELNINLEPLYKKD